MPKNNEYHYEPKKEFKNQTKVVEEFQPEVIIKYTNIQSLIEARLSYTGRVSGKQYEWHKAGSTVLVLEEDVPELLEKTLGKKTCCGNNSNRIFQIAQ